MNPRTRQHLAIAQEEHGYDPSPWEYAPRLTPSQWFAQPPPPAWRRIDDANRKVAPLYCEECGRETAYDLVYVPRTASHLRRCLFCETRTEATVH